MSLKTKGAFCSHCQTQVMAQGTKPNHILHLILTLATMGFWAWVWLIVTIAKAGKYRCSRCGNRV